MLLNGLGLAVTLQATYWLVAMLRGPARGVAAQLLVLALVGLSPWMSVAYTDLVSMPLVTLATALVVAVPRRALPRPGTAYRAACRGLPAPRLRGEDDPGRQRGGRRPGRAAGDALGLEPTRRPVAVGLLAGLALFAGGTVVAKQVAARGGRRSAERIDRSRTPPTVWWVYMATTQHAVDGHMRYGGYDTDIVRATRQLDREASAR